MYGRPNSAICFSGNAVVSGDGAMARRKGVVTTRVALLLTVILLVGSLMASRIFLTNQITGIRSRVADLENQKEFLEAGSAQLHLNWNRASNAEVVMNRARKELGLTVPESPGFVLVCLDKKSEDKSVWDRLKAGVLKTELGEVGSGAGEAMAGAVSEAMISLEPRGAWATTYDNGAD